MSIAAFAGGGFPKRAGDVIELDVPTLSGDAARDDDNAGISALSTGRVGWRLTECLERSAGKETKSQRRYHEGQQC
jgi:hypothetical protein